MNEDLFFLRDVINKHFMGKVKRERINGQKGRQRKKKEHN